MTTQRSFHRGGSIGAFYWRVFTTRDDDDPPGVESLEWDVFMASDADGSTLAMGCVPDELERYRDDGIMLAVRVATAVARTLAMRAEEEQLHGHH